MQTDQHSSQEGHCNLVHHAKVWVDVGCSLARISGHVGQKSKGQGHSPSEVFNSRDFCGSVFSIFVINGIYSVENNWVFGYLETRIKIGRFKFSVIHE